MNLLLCSVIILLLLLLLPGVKRTSGNNQQDYFSFERCKCIQGLLAVVITIHHVAIETSQYSFYTKELAAFDNVGILCVAFFFFCSGYGLITSLKNKERYLNGFLRKRVCSVIVPFFICNYAYVLTTLIMGENYSVKELICAFFGLLLLNGHLWFAVEIMILYLAFYLLFRFVKSERLVYISMGGFIIVMMTISFLLGHGESRHGITNWFYGEWWYNTTILFLLGMLAARFRNRLESIAGKYYITILIGAIILFTICFHVNQNILQNRGYWTETVFDPAYRDKLEALLIQIPTTIFFVMMIVLVMMKFHFHNKALAFLGHISLELILLNNIFIYVCAHTDLGMTMKTFTILELMFTTFAAMLLNRLKLIVLEKKK